MSHSLDELGGKARNLTILKDKYQVFVPFFKAITFSDLFRGFSENKAELEAIIGDYLAGLQSLELTTELLSLKVSKIQANEDVLAHLTEELKARKTQKISVRTSAALEDGVRDSFAGAYLSFLDLEPTIENLTTYSRQSFESVISENVLSYAANRQIKQFSVAGSVIFQEMFYGDYSGVLFSENGSSQIQIASTKNWQNVVVEGENATEIKVAKYKIHEARLPKKLEELCQIAIRIEQNEGVPVDIEWAYKNNQLAFLQFRPITTPNQEYSFEWDSTNISENYPGITLPLTYSVIRQFYGAVYLAFFRMLGAKPKDIANASPITENMLGYLDGRVYYRITNWYEAIKLMPGKRNQEYFEAMLNPVKKRGKADKSKLDFRSLITILRFAWLLISSERISRKFSREIKEKINQYEKINFEYLNAATILESGKTLRREILEDWAVTILNDVRLMVFHGILQRLYSKSDSPQDYLLLMQGLKDKASIRPLQRLSELGKLVVSAMEKENVSTVEDLQETTSWVEIKNAADEYRAEYAARTPGELKLENIRITDEIFGILELARKSSNSGIEASPSSGSRELSWPTNQSKLLRPLIKIVASQTRKAIDWRERFRFNRAQTFNISRMAYDAVGKALASEGILGSARDIYWLTDQEVEDLVGSHSPTMDGKDIVATRKRAFAEYEKKEKTLAVTGFGRIAGMHQVPVLSQKAEGGLAGNGVAPGLVTAEVIVVTSFDPKLDVRGKVLVVHYIDPGWTLLFTQAAAIISERGNALSHAAIISREIGIPAIVGAVGATIELKNGDLIQVNGNTGEITHV